MGKKTLQELVFKDDFMFGAVMAVRPENCAGVIEYATGIPVEHVEVSREKSVVYSPGFKGIRLDVYARDENNTHYDVEMQVRERPALPRRTRYYHSQMDVELLQSGWDYTELPDSIVIFICDYDPYGLGLYRYTFENLCKEKKELTMGDGCQTIYLSTCGKNDDEVPEALVKFLKYVKADLKESEDDFQDELVNRLQDTVRTIKANRKMEDRFMLWEEFMNDELRDAKKEGREEGRAEGLAEGLAEGRAEGLTEGRISVLFEMLDELGTIPEDLREKIAGEKDMEVLKNYVKKAMRSSTIEEFMKSIS